MNYTCQVELCALVRVFKATLILNENENVFLNICGRNKIQKFPLTLNLLECSRLSSRL
jgi:hypothetical protein